jgi:hypothetical protein
VISNRIAIQARVSEDAEYEHTEGRIRPGPLTAGESALSPTDLVESWLATALSSSSGEGYGPARAAIFVALRSDPADPIAGRLLELVKHPDSLVRGVVLQLLTHLAPPLPARRAVAEAGVSRLADSDVHVRRRAAWLVAAADHDRARSLLGAGGAELEPIARLALVEAVIGTRCPHPDCPCHALVEALMMDSDPAVRLRAGLAFARWANAAELSRLQATLIEDVAAAGRRLAGPGSRLRLSAGMLWAGALIRQDLESECYLQVARLLTRPEPVCRLAGVEMALEAVRRWRAAAAALSSALAGVLDDEAVEVRLAAAGAIGASLELSRAHADKLAALLRLPGFREVAGMALGRIGDSRVHAQSGGGGDALAALRREVDAGHRGCAAERSGGCSLGRAVMAVGVLASTDEPAAAAGAMVGALEVLIERTDPFHDAVRWQIVGRLGDLGALSAAAVPLVERLLAGDAKGSWTAPGVLALVKITGDRARAEQLLDSYMAEPTERRAARRLSGQFPAQILAWLSENGGLAERHVEFVQRLVCAEPRRVNPRALVALWRARGTQVADLVRTTLADLLDDDLWGPLACEVFTEMGTDAAYALPALNKIVRRRHRLGFHIGDLDAELRADEQLLAAALAAREAIARAMAARHRRNGPLPNRRLQPPARGCAYDQLVQPPSASSDALISAFPRELAGDARAVLAVMPAHRLLQAASFSVLVQGQHVTIPGRLYNDEPSADAVAKLSTRQRQLLHCLYSRHCDGRVRQRHLEEVICLDDPWVVPFIVQLVGEYVLEILVIIRDELRDLATPGTHAQLAYARFILDNPAYFDRIQRRVTSYWNCYYRAAYTSFRGYPGCTLLDLLRSAASEVGERRLANLTPATGTSLDGYC